MSSKRFWKWRYIVPAALIGFPLFLALGGQVVKLLWNWLLPPLFGWPQITAWQGLGLLALCRILFGGVGGGGGGGPRSHRMSRKERRRLRARLCAPGEVQPPPVVGPTESEQRGPSGSLD